MSASPNHAAAVLKVLVGVADAIVDVVREAGPLGVGESYIHLALARHGATPDQAKQFVELIVESGRLERHPGPKLRVPA